MTRNEAWEIVCEFVKNENLRKHMLAVECAMRSYAQKYDKDSESWGLAGLLHDFDWEVHPSLEEHPSKGAQILRKRGVDEETIQTIQSHANHTGVPRDSLMRQALFACDELTGLITACAMVRPKKIMDLEVSSIKKKFKQPAFAAGVNRQDVTDGAKELNVDLWTEHVPLVLEAMKQNAQALGLD